MSGYEFSSGDWHSAIAICEGGTEATPAQIAEAAISIGWLWEHEWDEVGSGNTIPALCDEAELRRQGWIQRKGKAHDGTIVVFTIEGEPRGFIPPGSRYSDNPGD